VLSEAYDARLLVYVVPLFSGFTAY